MSQAEELLNELLSGSSEHEHTVVDSDSYFVIDPSTREIKSTARKKNVLFVGDHNSEVYTFEVPRYVEGHDMKLCTSIKVHYDNIDGETGDENSSVVDLYDLRVNPANPETVICSWTIERQVIQFVGILSFALQYLCADGEGNITYEWHTDSYDAVEVKAGRNYSERAVFEYTDILEQWRARIFGAADSIKSEFEEVSNAQQELIKEEGARQAAAVVDKGVEVLSTIPEDYTVTHNMAEKAVRGMAGAIEVVAEGETVVINDSSNLHLHGLNVYGKSSQVTTTGAQLINPAEYDFDDGYTNNGVTVTINNDGSITLTGTPTIESGRVVTLFSGELIDYMVDGEQYCTNTTFEYVENGAKLYNRILTIDKSKHTSVRSYVQRDVSNYKNNETIYHMVNKGREPLPYEPYSGGIPAPNPSYPQEIESVDKPTITLKSKNLASLTASGSITNKGTEMTVNDDGSITVAGTATGAVLYTIADNLMLLPGTYTLSGCPNGGGDLTYDLRYGEGGLYRDFGEGNTFTITEPMVSSLGMMIRNGTTLSNVVFRPMIMEVSIKDTKFEKAVNQSLLVAQKLYGIPVESGGNYTDPTGQQWVCDEIDLERGVKVQRVDVDVITDSPNFIETVDQPGRFNWFCLPNGKYKSGREISISNYATFRAWGIAPTPVDKDYCAVSVNQIYYSPLEPMTAEEVNAKFEAMIANGNPPTIMAQLDTPIEIPLTAEEIEAYKTLRSYYPSTTVFNDANAFMRVKYVTDTKTYIDNKFAELASLITSQNN